MKHNENCMCIECDDTTDVTEEEIGNGMIVGWAMVASLAIVGFVMIFCITMMVHNVIDREIESRVEREV